MVEPHKAAIRRTSLSKPAQLLLDTQLLPPGGSILDYGCGHGDDVKRLLRKGFAASGWDPHFFPKKPRDSAQVVNLGYVLNVIATPAARTEVLTDAFSLAENLLLVAVRSFSDAKPDKGKPWGDGYVTSLGTFQKYFDQTELKNWIASTLQRRPVALAPGIVAVFRHDEDRQSFLSSRFTRRFAIRSEHRAHETYTEFKEVLDGFFAIYAELGRPPHHEEWEGLHELEATVGSSRRAVSVLRHVHGGEPFDEVRQRGSEDLLVFLALERLEGRLRFGQLAEKLQRDVRWFFKSYMEACQQADRLLFSAGNPLLIDAACRDSKVGKLTGNALYVHTSALGELEPVLRVYEGCARFLLGDIEGVNVIKLARKVGAVSYLVYPGFQTVAHPELASAYRVELRNLTARFEDFSGRDNRPVLHRKELMLSPSHPLHRRFERLTLQEERAGLLQDNRRIGTRQEWNEVVSGSGFSIRGHRLLKDG